MRIAADHDLFLSYLSREDDTDGLPAVEAGTGSRGPADRIDMDMSVRVPEVEGIMVTVLRCPGGIGVFIRAVLCLF